MSVEMEGFGELLKKFDKLENATEDKRRMLKRASDSVQQDIKNAAEELDDEKFTDENMKYGRLHENIEIELKGDTVGITTGNAYWSVFLEHGTVYTDKQPFMYSTFKKSKKKAMREIEREMKRKLGL